MAKKPSAIQFVQEFLYNWDGEFVIHCVLVEGPVINTEALNAIGLHDEENWY